MISVDEVIGIWENLRVKWFYPQIPLPEIRSGGKWDNKIYFDNYEISLNLREMPSDIELQKEYIENILEHEMCHYIYCPYDIETVAGFILESRKALSEVYGSENISPSHINLCVNFFTDIVVENFRFKRNLKENAESKIISFHKNKLKDAEKTSKIYEIFISTLGKIWNCDFEVKDPEINKFSGKLSDSLKDTENRKFWNRQCYIASTTISPFFEDEDESVEEKSFVVPLPLKVLTSILGMGKGGKGDKNDEEKKEKAPEKFSGYEKHRYVEELEKRKKETPLVRAAEESDLKEYKELVKILGITDDEHEALKKWYRDQAYGIIISPVERYDKDEYPTAPKKWRVSDPPSELDFIYSKSLSPIIIPGVTAFKREREMGEIHPIERKMPDMLIIVDSSSSMGGHLRGTKTFYAMLAAFKAYRYALNKGSRVAVINFSGKDNKPLYRKLEYTRNADLIEDSLTHYYGLYTCIPGTEIEKLSAEGEILILLLTDTEIQNFETEIKHIENAASKNYFVLMCTSSEKQGRTLDKLKKLGKVYFIKNPKDLIGLTIDAAKKAYGTSSV